jgi:hypothetical protein
MNNMISKKFGLGARVLAEATATVRNRVGISPDIWKFIQSDQPWLEDETARVPGYLQTLCNGSLTIAGLPQMMLPGHYIAMIICTHVSPVNRMTAAVCAPRAYDAISASGLIGKNEVTPMTQEQMLALVTYFSHIDTEFMDVPGQGFSDVLLAEIKAHIEANSAASKVETKKEKM